MSDQRIDEQLRLAMQAVADTAPEPPALPSSEPEPRRSLRWLTWGFAAAVVIGLVSLVVIRWMGPDEAQPPTSTTTTTGPFLDVTLRYDGLDVAGRVFLLGARGEFGTDDDLVAALTTIIGPPIFDSGWGPQYVVAEGSEGRYVQWDEGFAIRFDDTEIPGAGAVRHFADYTYGGAPAGIFTVGGVTAGSTVGEVVSAVERYRPGEGFDQHEWVITHPQNFATGEVLDFWMLRAGTDETGHLCFRTYSAVEPTDTARIGPISAGWDCDFWG